ncbi:maleylacetate reductase [Bacillus sp. 1P02SD]|uniref:maleylacetate reductase n=1 Tax=Bacillus sp. 1P02SD TaxID=3132264 RepID=UPI0039A16E5E
MKEFIYHAQPSKVYFGEGVVNKVGECVNDLGLKNFLIITSPGQSGKAVAEKISNELGDRCYGVYPKAIQHVPNEIVEEALTFLQDKEIDGLISIGGGSSVGLAKAIALNTNLPIIAIPTNYSGSELTHVWGITTDGIKTTGRNPVVKPKVVLFDSELTMHMPIKLTVVSAINAMAHCVEALYSENPNPISSIMAGEGIRAIAEGLPKLYENPLDIEARTKVLFGAWLSGTVLDTVPMGVHHRICHTLGGTCNLSHADTHTMILPYAIAYIKDYAPEAIKAIARAIGTETDDVAGFLFDFIQDLGGPKSLKELGLKEEDIKKAAAVACRKPLTYPRPIDEESIEILIRNAFSGKRPSREMVY